MADVWISRKRWTCKYCDVTINDDLPSRRHHETGVRHKQNVQKALQDLYRKGEQERKDAEQMRKEMERIEALAAESYAKDQAAAGSSGVAPSASSQAAINTSASRAAPSHAKPKPYSAPKQRPAKPAGEADQHGSQPEAQAGAWEEVETSLPQSIAPSASSSYVEVSDRERARSFRMKEKVARLDDSDEDDGLGAIKLKKRPRSSDSDGAESTPDKATGSISTKREADPSLSLIVKKEEDDAAESGLPKDEASSEADRGGGGLFKKRRSGAGAGAKRVRAVI